MFCLFLYFAIYYLIFNDEIIRNLALHIYLFLDIGIYLEILTLQKHLKFWIKQKNTLNFILK